MNCAVIVCGGRGTRMGAGSVSKTLLKVGGVPSAVRCALAFRRAGCRLILVTPPGGAGPFKEALEHRGIRDAVFIPGGKERADSVFNGLQAVESPDDLVLVHDGARPLVTAKLIRRCVACAEKHRGAVPALKNADTLKKADPDGRVISTVDREGIYRVQTPQCFYAGDLKAAYAAARGRRFTDEAALMENAGFPVCLCEGDPANIKLTAPEDLVMANRLVSRVYRTGFGLDAHRLTEGRRLVLCGVDIPFEKGLDGHSDADVALHALADALLGAAAMGDIGKLYPDNDDRYLGISSMLLLKDTAERVRREGFDIVSCDITVVCQRPKLAPYIPEMRRNIASCLGVAPGRVSVKATTTEKMGYEGRGEGISAHACATLSQEDFDEEDESSDTQ